MKDKGLMIKAIFFTMTMIMAVFLSACGGGASPEPATGTEGAMGAVRGDNTYDCASGTKTEGSCAGLTTTGQCGSFASGTICRCCATQAQIEAAADKGYKVMAAGNFVQGTCAQMEAAYPNDNFEYKCLDPSSAEAKACRSVTEYAGCGAQKCYYCEFDGDYDDCELKNYWNKGVKKDANGVDFDVVDIDADCAAGKDVIGFKPDGKKKCCGAIEPDATAGEDCAAKDYWGKGAGKDANGAAFVIKKMNE
ncbi:MAG: hypothetical protein KKF44_08670, partial [Nanoarchaeota archaeon]|nr:hypothetical protein [Nanoarchaeota archaeon]